MNSLWWSSHVRPGAETGPILALVGCSNDASWARGPGSNLLIPARCFSLWFLMYELCLAETVTRIPESELCLVYDPSRSCTIPVCLPLQNKTSRECSSRGSRCYYWMHLQRQRDASLASSLFLCARTVCPARILLHLELVLTSRSHTPRPLSAMETDGLKTWSRFVILSNLGRNIPLNWLRKIDRGRG